MVFYTIFQIGVRVQAEGHSKRDGIRKFTFDRLLPVKLINCSPTS